MSCSQEFRTAIPQLLLWTKCSAGHSISLQYHNINTFACLLERSQKYQAESALLEQGLGPVFSLALPIAHIWQVDFAPFGFQIVAHMDNRSRYLPGMKLNTDPHRTMEARTRANLTGFILPIEWAATDSKIHLHKIPNAAFRVFSCL